MVVSSNNGKTPLNVSGNKLSTIKPELYRGGVGRHFDVQVGGVLTLEFLRLTNAKHPGQTNGVGLTNVDGGSILISGGGYGLFTSITWSGNEASDGGAVAVKGIPSVSTGPSVFIRCEFFGNKASSGGGGALLFNKTQAIVVDSNFANNHRTAFEKYTDYSCASRNEGGVFDGGTLQECESLCKADSTCVSFEYFPEDHASVPKRCQLSTSCTTANMGSDNNVDLYIKVDVSPYGQFGRDISLLDNVTLYLLSTEKAFSTPDIVDYVSKQRKYISSE